MPAGDAPAYEQALVQLLMQSLAELPVSVQLALFRDAKLSNRPLLYVDVRGPSELGNTERDWFLQNKESLAFGLIHRHGLDLNRIALLHEFGVMGPPLKAAEARLRFSYGAVKESTGGAVNKSGGAEIQLEEAAITTAILLEFDAAFRVAFEPLGLTDLRPMIRLTGGSVETFLSKSAAGVGLLILLDVFTGGATLPATLPIYAQVAAAGALIAPQTVNFINEQRNKSALRNKTLAETAKLERETQAIPDKALLDAKALAEIEKVKTETARLAAEAAKAKAEAIKETRALLERVGSEVSTTKDQSEKLHAEAMRLFAELVGPATATKAASWTPPPAAEFSAEAIQQAAKANNVGSPVAALAVNVGIPILAKAKSVGADITRLSPE